jgi:GTPase SAR1 family protein
MGQKLLNLVSGVKSRIGEEIGFPIPQFILIGKQSVGKSRVTEVLAGETFNFVSGTLGSRRPTILEFRHSNSETGQWSIMVDGAWKKCSVDEVHQRVTQAHESLGMTVTTDAVNLRLESPNCVDIQIIDLPGFRDFALDAARQELNTQIDRLVTGFMNDTRNIMICVEEAGDAANAATLARCKKIDPDFKRTILVRNKLDKAYKSLNSQNVNQWIQGYGDLPENLMKFAISCPHFSGPTPPKPFVQMRDEASTTDVETLKKCGASNNLLKLVGFHNFEAYTASEIERVFGNAVRPCMEWIQRKVNDLDKDAQELNRELSNTDPTVLIHTIQATGAMFASAASPVMGGHLAVHNRRVTLEQELLDFADWCEVTGEEIELRPSEDFACVEDYIDFLRLECKVPSFEVELNGGAQYKRLKYECEVYFRFADIGSEVSPNEVARAAGGGKDWLTTVTKLCGHKGVDTMKVKVNYVKLRLQYFFMSHKAVLQEFMATLQGSAEEHLFSNQFTTMFPILRDNDIARNLIFQKFDDVVMKCGKNFEHLLHYSIEALFAKPDIATKESSVTFSPDDSALEDMTLPSHADTVQRVKEERQDRKRGQMTMKHMTRQIEENSAEDDQVDRVQAMLIMIFKVLRNRLADQLELMAESFFLLPMLRLLEAEMHDIELDEKSKAEFAIRREHLSIDKRRLQEKLDNFKWALNEVEMFHASMEQAPRKLTST